MGSIKKNNQQQSDESQETLIKQRLKCWENCDTDNGSIPYLVKQRSESLAVTVEEQQKEESKSTVYRVRFVILASCFPR